MKDLKARTDELLAGFRASGYCTTCWAFLEAHPHFEWCEEREEE